MTDEQVPVIGGPLDGQTHRLRLTASRMIVPDSSDMIHGIKDGEPYTLFGQHTYEMKCYVKDGEKFYRWEHIGYQKPEVQFAASLESETVQFTNGDDIAVRLTRWCEQPDDRTETQALMDQAAREIERLQRSVTDWQLEADVHRKRAAAAVAEIALLRLTDAEREAVERAAFVADNAGLERSAATLRKMLENATAGERLVERISLTQTLLDDNERLRAENAQLRLTYEEREAIEWCLSLPMLHRDVVRMMPLRSILERMT